MLQNRRGFTLIEILIVLAILAGIITLGVPRLMKKQDNFKTIARKMMVLSRQTRNNARLYNATYRLAFKLDDKNSAYWVEKASGPKLVDQKALLEENESPKAENDKDAPPPAFQKDESLIAGENPLPSGMKFSLVETINMPNPVTTGTAYIHYSPDGFVEASVVQLTNSKNQTWTLVINPLTGQADIVEEARTLKDLQR